MTAPTDQNPKHTTHVERASTGAFYAWCDQRDCDWRSPRRRSEIDVKDSANDHERETRGERTVIR